MGHGTGHGMDLGWDMGWDMGWTRDGMWAGNGVDMGWDVGWTWDGTQEGTPGEPTRCPHTHVSPRVPPAGGAPDPRSLTAGKFTSGITGCLRGLALAPAGTPRHPIDLRHGAVGGSPAPPCPS